MSIKFVCSCGKHLRARDEMAARRSRCPRCGQPVGIPSLRPTHAGTEAAPLTPLERLQRRRVVPRPAEEPIAATDVPDLSPPPTPVTVVPRAPETEVVRLPPEAAAVKTPVDWPRELNPAACLLYPLRAVPILLGLSVLLTIVFLPLVFLIAGFSQQLEEAQGDTPLLLFLLAPCGLIPFAVVGYACATMEGALTSALCGQFRYLAWPGRNLRTAFRSGWRWLVCFLAGPVVPVLLAGWYWLHSGDLRLVDRLMLLQLGAVALGYLGLALASVHLHGRLRGAAPDRVADLADRLGPAFVAGVFGVAALAAAAFAALVWVHEEMHNTPAVGVFGLPVGWFAALFAGTYLCRLLGAWCYRIRLLERAAVTTAVVESQPST